jgi:membrane fusion protein (multidrug efflux system)
MEGAAVPPTDPSPIAVARATPLGSPAVPPQPVDAPPPAAIPLRPDAQAAPGGALAFHLRRLAIPVACIAVVGATLAFTNLHWDAWAAGASTQTTDDAYVHADVSVLSARVGGNVVAVHVHDYETVRAGDPLVEIDPADYQAAVEAAEAAVAGARAALANLKNQEALQVALVGQAEAEHASATAIATEMKQEFDRQDALLKGGLVGTVRQVQQATADLAKAAAEVRATDAAVVAQQRQLDVLDGQEASLEADLDAAKANLEAARLKLGYTRVVAPFDGTVGTRQVQVGDYVTVGTNLIAVVPIPAVYVMANFKETQLTRVEPGQPVDITVDTFPGTVLRGRVERLSPASGAVFALLPPDNATGNFTKVVQRIPVRIAFEPDQPLVAKLRAGMSVEARIHVDAPQ